jgi:hypothetical protein
MNHDFDLYSPIGGHADEEESTFLSDLVIGLLVVACCMTLGLALAESLPFGWWPL